MIAIETRYLPATDKRPPRIKAFTANPGQQVVMSVDLAANLSPDKGNHYEDTHRVVAEALRDKMGWTGNLACGGTKRGYVFVFTD